MTDEVDELKNIVSDFKILGAKVNDDNKNKKKKLDETKELLEICKKEYQKLYFEHENLKKLNDNLVTQYNMMRKKKTNSSQKKEKLLFLKILRKPKVTNQMRKMRKKNKLKKKVK